jgi:periplasmic protein CpxP/Spy
MTYIKNNKVLVFIIGVLLLSNIAMLYFYLTKKNCEDKPKEPNKPRGEFMVEKLKNEVGFTDSQIAQYREIRSKHKEGMKPMFDDIFNAKDSLYKLLVQPQAPSDAVVKHYLEEIGNKQEVIDQRIFNHFLALKQLCTPEQLPRYDSTIQKVIKGMINPRWGGGPDKKKDDNKK